MTAMVGALLPYVMTLAAAVPSAAVGSSALCTSGDVCEPAAIVALGEAAERDAWWLYATPAQVDCRNLRLAAGGGSGKADDVTSGACSQPAWDFRYRVSRFADGERSSGAFGPQHGRGVIRSAVTFTSTWRGLPVDRGTSPLASPHPLAIYADALAPMVAARLTNLTVSPDRRTPSRVIEPLERPPRV